MTLPSSAASSSSSSSSSRSSSSSSSSPIVDHDFHHDEHGIRDRDIQPLLCLILQDGHQSFGCPWMPLPILQLISQYAATSKTRMRDIYLFAQLRTDSARRMPNIDFEWAADAKHCHRYMQRLATQFHTTHEVPEMHEVVRSRPSQLLQEYRELIATFEEDEWDDSNLLEMHHVGVCSDGTCKFIAKKTRFICGSNA